MEDRQHAARPQRVSRRLERLSGFAILAAFAALGVVVYVRDPESEGLGLCLVRLFTGWYCPGCGGTRAVHRLLHGDLYGAMRMNGLLLLLLIPISYMLLAEIIRRIAGRAVIPQLVPQTWMILVAGILLLLYTVLRNLPTFAFLAPVAI